MKKLLLLTSLFLTTMAFSQADSLIASYNFNACNAIDGVSPKANGTVFQTTFTADRFGNPAAAVGFAGNSAISYGAPSKLLVNSGLTISAWVYCTSLSGQQAIVSKWANSAAIDQYLFMLNNGKLFLAIGNPGFSASGYTGNTTLAVNTWYHVVATWDTSGIHETYINGVLDLSVVNANFANINSTSATNLYIGCQSGSSRFFNGNIDDVKIFNKKLSTLEINELYNEANWNTQGGLVSKYTFNNGNQNDELNDNDPIYTGYTASNDRFGNTNSALDINPTASYVNFNDSYDGFSTYLTGSATYSFWLNFNVINGTNQIILAKSADGGCSGNDRTFLLKLNANNKLELSVYSTPTAGNYIVLEGGPAMTAGTWYNVVITYDGTQTGVNKYNLYVNNNQYSFSSTNTSGLGMNNGPRDAAACLAVGAYLKSDGTMCANTQRLNAKFDDFYIYNRILTATDVNNLYNEGDPMAVGINNLRNSNQTKAYPNPFNNQINLNLETKSSVYVYSIDGKEMFSSSVEKGNSSINTEEWATGMYIIKTISEKGTSSKKLIKQ